MHSNSKDNEHDNHDCDIGDCSSDDDDDDDDDW